MLLKRDVKSFAPLACSIVHTCCTQVNQSFTKCYAKSFAFSAIKLCTNNRINVAQSVHKVAQNVAQSVHKDLLTQAKLQMTIVTSLPSVQGHHHGSLGLEPILVWATLGPIGLARRRYE